MPVKHCLVTVGGDLLAVGNENDQTLLPLLAMTSRTITFAGALEKGLFRIFLSTSDIGRPVRYLLLRRLIRALATKTFLSEKMRTLQESSPLSLRSNYLALLRRFSCASMVRTGFS